MPSFFGTPWSVLSEEDVVGFLADAGDEGLLWEAKDGAEPRRDSVRKAVCGLANAQGGFLIIGAERAAGVAWNLAGVEFGSSEPATWLSSVIADGLSPLPSFDVRVFRRPNDRSAAVVAVEPLAAAPCMTTSGVVYQRVTGQTLPVTDNASSPSSSPGGA
jgi:predicted HTH transcriptional regulator